LSAILCFLPHDGNQLSVPSFGQLHCCRPSTAQLMLAPVFSRPTTTSSSPVDWRFRFLRAYSWSRHRDPASQPPTWSCHGVF
jgi:hypothetical protein